MTEYRKLILLYLWYFYIARPADFGLKGSMFGNRSLGTSYRPQRGLRLPNLPTWIDGSGAAWHTPCLVRAWVHVPAESKSKTMAPLRVFVGWDPREEIAYQVCRWSLQVHSSIPIEIVPIKQADMRNRGLYWRSPDPLSSTEFSFTRFLTPYLANYRGWAVFVDCDFLFRKDIAGLLDYRDPSKALYCVQHNYVPDERLKMSGQRQTLYPRKNWSSFMLINCGHEQVLSLTPDTVNRTSGLYLHRFQWLTDDVIGSLPVTWNYLEGWHTAADCEDPIAIHFTRGGPWLEEYQAVDYAQEWTSTANNLGVTATHMNRGRQVTHAVQASLH